MTHFRNRVGDEALETLSQETLAAAHRAGALSVRVARYAAMKTGRYLHAQQKKRARRQLKFMRVRLRRLIRDVRRKMQRIPALSERTAKRLETVLDRAWHIAQQQRGDKGYLYSWHATEVECISKGKARAPYEFGCKVSIATNLHPAKGGHFILQARALHCNPYDGHTLKQALDDVRELVGRSPLRSPSTR